MKPEGIIIHCSDSPQGRGDDASTIHKWHLERNWDGIGYHYVILEDGTVQNGRPDYWAGAHAKRYNDYLGVCLIGKDTFTKEQFTALEVLVSVKLNEYDLTIDKVLGHYEVSEKTCPNFDVAKFRKLRGFNNG